MHNCKSAHVNLYNIAIAVVYNVMGYLLTVDISNMFSILFRPVARLIESGVHVKKFMWASRHTTYNLVEYVILTSY